jgi:hypothetical protein
MQLLPQDGQSRITLGEPGSGWWVCGMAHLHPEPPSGDWDKPAAGFDRVLGAGQVPEAASFQFEPILTRLRSDGQPPGRRRFSISGLRRGIC